MTLILGLEIARRMKNTTLKFFPQVFSGLLHKENIFWEGSKIYDFLKVCKMMKEVEKFGKNRGDFFSHETQKLL